MRARHPWAVTAPKRGPGSWHPRGENRTHGPFPGRGGRCLHTYVPVKAQAMLASAPAPSMLTSTLTSQLFPPQSRALGGQGGGLSTTRPPRALAEVWEGVERIATHFNKRSEKRKSRF